MNKNAFTLIELLAVIIVLGILLVIGVPAVNTLINNSKIKTFKANAKLIINQAKNEQILNDDVVVFKVSDLLSDSKNKKSSYNNEYTENSFVVVIPDINMQYIFLDDGTHRLGTISADGYFVPVPVSSIDDYDISDIYSYYNNFGSYYGTIGIKIPLGFEKYSFINYNFDYGSNSFTDILKKGDKYYLFENKDGNYEKTSEELTLLEDGIVSIKLARYFENDNGKVECIANLDKSSCSSGDCEIDILSNKCLPQNEICQISEYGSGHKVGCAADGIFPSLLYDNDYNYWVEFAQKVKSQMGTISFKMISENDLFAYFEQDYKQIDSISASYNPSLIYTDYFKNDFDRENSKFDTDSLSYKLFGSKQVSFWIFSSFSTYVTNASGEFYKDSNGDFIRYAYMGSDYKGAKMANIYPHNKYFIINNLNNKDNMKTKGYLFKIDLNINDLVDGKYKLCKDISGNNCEDFSKRSILFD